MSHLGNPTAEPKRSAFPQPLQSVEWLPGLLAVGVFGPYTPLPGLRIEQLVAYLVLPILVFTRGIRREDAPGLDLVRLCWFILVALGLAASIVGYLSPPPHLLPETRTSFGLSLNELDNYLMPLVILLTLPRLIGRDPARFERRFLQWLSALACLNVFVALFQSFGALQTMLPIFWGETSDVSVAVLAAARNRVSGVFNQPAEAGFVYAVVLVSASKTFASRRWVAFLCSGVVVFGGFLCASKILTVAGLAVWCLQQLRSRSISSRSISMLMLVGVPTAVAGAAFFRDGFAVKNVFAVALSGDDSLLKTMSAGRFGDQSTLEEVVGATLRTSPSVGVGYVRPAFPFDNGWVAIFTATGLIGLGIFSVVLWLFFVQTKGTRASSGELSLSRTVFWLVLLGSLGLPVLTANRTATVSWVLMVVAFCSRGKKPTSGRNTSVQRLGRRSSSSEGHTWTPRTYLSR
jgi:hypothetical protein